jgi:hypothetical protein
LLVCRNDLVVRHHGRKIERSEMIVGVGEIGVRRREEQHRRGSACGRAHEERKVIAAAARLQPHRIDAARQGLGQPELKIVGPARFNHVVVMELHRAILIRLFEERIARAVPVAPGYAALAAIENAAGRPRESGREALVREVLAEPPRGPWRLRRRMAPAPRHAASCSTPGAAR